MPMTTLIVRYGLPAIFLGAGIEGEASVITGGVLAHQGLISLPCAMAAAVCGSFLIDQLWFHLGRHARHFRYIDRQLERPSATRVIAQLERHPTAFIFGFRFIYGLRTISPIVIGATDIRASRFIVLNMLAAATWGSLFTLVGYFLGPALDPLLHDLRHAAVLGGATFLLIVILITATLAAKRRIGRPTM